MTLITIYTVVYISADAGMMKIGRVPAPMALRALEDRVVRGIGMARSTHAVGRVLTMIQGKIGVIEYCAGPGCRRVAGRTGCRESGCRVGGIRCGVVLCRVATVAIGWQRREVVVHVAACTRN
jgi:hypothetical protein